TMSACPACRPVSSSGHRAADVGALTGLGAIHRMQGRYEQATDHYQRALQLARAVGERNGEQIALLGLGVVHEYAACTSRQPTAPGGCLTWLGKAAAATGSSKRGRGWADSTMPPAIRMPRSPTTTRPWRSPSIWNSPTTKPTPTTGSPTPTTHVTS